ncbi:hypothetical protein Bhyg_15566 [Pseudolycoriella hygida]|uniref:Uncharacterized protein n=1 Tax=Pseudolycoriella hygida TaxID=35572 RepID=A0A9Q0RTV5_9DIPT|nr:hypothetical protein Bhyg_15566 [Pseudolycoriella hygida]
MKDLTHTLMDHLYSMQRLLSIHKSHP